MNKFILGILILIFTLSCNQDDNIQVEVTTDDFETTINENPLRMEEIGYVIGDTSNGNVIFEIESQIPQGAMSIDSESGLLRVDDPSKFNHDVNPTITGVVKVSNGEVFMNSNITIHIIPEITVTTADFEITIDENPEPNQVLGMIEGTTNQGEVEFTLISQNPEGAFSIDSTTGELRVHDASLFVFQQNPALVGVVKVANGNVSENANITVHLNDMFCITSNEEFQQEMLDWGANESAVVLSYTMDAKTHEYSFSPNSNTSLCSIGYQGYDETPYLMELVDENGTILLSEMIAFSSTEQSVYVLSTSIDLISGETYTIRRTQNDYIFLNEIIGYIFLSDLWVELDFPFVFNDITITGSNFYGGGGPIPDMGIPFITLGFD